MDNKSNALSPAMILQRAAYHGQITLVRRLIEEHVDVNVCDQWGRTALSLASRQGHLDIVRELVAASAWIDPHDDYDTHETPLIAAAESGHLDIVHALVTAGADPTIHAGGSQATAEFYARLNGHTRVSKYLLEAEQKWIEKNND